jgi:hypothetical protein
MRRTARRLTFIALFALAGVALFALTPVGSAKAPPKAKPVIGKAAATPAKAVAGERFTVSARVTRSDTGGALARGALTCTPTAGGKAIAHTQALRSGVARCSFVVPTTATSLRVVLAVKAGAQSATRAFVFAVQPVPKPTVSVGDVTVAEGNSGTTIMSFPVTLSKASKLAVSVSYTTANGTATAPADYASANGSLAFAPGETSKAIAVSIVADTAIELDETLSVTLSSPVNATIAKGSATGTIRNEDTQVPVTVGSWKGQTPSGDYMYFEVNPDRTMSYFRLNDLRENCSPGGYFEGSLAFRPEIKWPIAADGTSGSADSWSGTDVEGDFTFTYAAYSVVAHFNGSTASGTIRLQDQFTYKGTAYSCDTGNLAWTAAPIS